MNQISKRAPRAVVLGASGFVGTRLVRRLTGQGYAVAAVDILPPRERFVGADYITADVREPLGVEIGLGAQVLYNLAAVHRTPGHPPHEYYDTNVMGAANATALAETCDIPLIVFTSSISVYGPSELVVTEQSPLQPASDYGRSKRMAEVVHRKWLEADPDRQLVIVRPGVIFGPGERGNYTNLARALQRRIFAYPGRKDAVKSGGHVDELLRCLEFAIAKRQREVLFNFAFPDESTTEEIVATFGKICGVPSRYPTIPVAPLMAAARVCEAADALGLPNPIHRDRVLKLVNSTRVAPAWLLANDYEFELDLERALEGWATETAGRFD